MPSKGPEILAEAMKGIEDVKVIFISRGKLKDKLSKFCKKNKIDNKEYDHIRHIFNLNITTIFL